MVTSPYDSRAAYASATLRPRTRASSAAASSGCQARAVTLTAIVTRPPSTRGPPAGERLRARLVDGRDRGGRRERQLERLDFLPEQALGGRLGGGVAHGRRVLHERRPRRGPGRLGPGRREPGGGGGGKGGQRR